MGPGRYVPSYMKHTTSSRLKGNDKEKYEYYRWKADAGNKRARQFGLDTEDLTNAPFSPRFMKPTSSWEGKVADRHAIPYKPRPRRHPRSVLITHTMDVISTMPLHSHADLLDTPRGDRISCHVTSDTPSQATTSSALNSPSTATSNDCGALKCMPVFKSPSLDVPRYMMPTASYNCRLYLD